MTLRGHRPCSGPRPSAAGEPLPVTDPPLAGPRPLHSSWFPHARTGTNQAGNRAELMISGRPPAGFGGGGARGTGGDRGMGGGGDAGGGGGTGPGMRALGARGRFTHGWRLGSGGASRRRPTTVVESGPWCATPLRARIGRQGSTRPDAGGRQVFPASSHRPARRRNVRRRH